MENEEIIKDAIVESSKEVAKNIYEDGFKPAVENVGGILDVFTGFFYHFVLYPLKKLNIKYKEKAIAYERKMQEKYNNIPLENRVEPELHIVGPAMESLKYNIMQDDLAEMFSNLLVSDMDSNTQKLCSPAFVKIIEQMSPVDARVFKEIFDTCHNNPEDAVAIGRLKLSTVNEFYIRDDDNIPQFLAGISTKKFDSLNLSKSIISLERLGLIELDFLHVFKDNRYELLLNQKNIVDLAKKYSFERGREYTPKFIERGIIYLNSISYDFAKVCFREK